MPRLKQQYAVNTNVVQIATPTPERLLKSEFAEGSPRRVISTVQSLHNAGAIGDDELAAAQRLRRDLLFAREGYRDPPLEKFTSSVQHDQLSWRMTRAMAGAELNALRISVRAVVFELLELMLGDEMSFSEIARRLKSGQETINSSDRSNASAQCALALKLLVEAYADCDAARRKKRHLAKTDHVEEKKAFLVDMPLTAAIKRFRVTSIMML